MQNRQMTGVTIPDMSVQAYEEVCERFKRKKLKDTDTLLTAGRYEGRQEVLDYLQKFVAERTASGNPDDIDPTEQPLSPTQRLTLGINRE